MWHARLKTKPKKKIFKWSSGQGLEIMTSAGSAADRKHVGFASRNGSRPSEQLFVQEEGEKSGWSALIKACPSTFRGRRAGRFSAPRLSWRH